MKLIKANNKEILIIEIPSYSITFTKYNRTSKSYTGCGIQINSTAFGDDYIQLPMFKSNSEYEIIGKLSELTHNDCKELVESDSFLDTGDFGLGAVTYYRSYPNELKDSFDLDLDAKESFILLLQSSGIDLTKEQLILMIK